MEKTQTLKNAPYREAVGSLLYLASATRPDISYAVNVLSRHQVSPTKRVFRYLKGTKSMYLRYTGENEKMEAYSDVSWADCKNSLTTCGFVINMFGDIICWRTHKQSYVALSTCEAEFVAMSEASQETVSILNSIKLILNNNFLPISLWCDNQAAIACVQVDGGNKLRHMVEIKRDYVKKCVKNNIIKAQWVCSKKQLADIFTKPLPFETHKYLTNRIMNFI